VEAVDGGAYRILWWYQPIFLFLFWGITMFIFHEWSVYAFVVSELWTMGLVIFIYHWSSPICHSCIPCGHVYGRSCLVKWLHRCGDDTAKVPCMNFCVYMPYLSLNWNLSLFFSQCPQCGEQFEDKLIINLYAPGNLWDGCCRLEVMSFASGVLVYKCQIMNHCFLGILIDRSNINFSS
jgi:hypothetical protein